MKNKKSSFNNLVNKIKDSFKDGFKKGTMYATIPLLLTTSAFGKNILSKAEAEKYIRALRTDAYEWVMQQDNVIDNVDQYLANMGIKLKDYNHDGKINIADLSFAPELYQFFEEAEKKGVEIKLNNETKKMFEGIKDFYSKMPSYTKHLDQYNKSLDNLNKNISSLESLLEKMPFTTIEGAYNTMLNSINQTNSVLEKLNYDFISFWVTLINIPGAEPIKVAVEKANINKLDEIINKYNAVYNKGVKKINQNIKTLVNVKRKLTKSKKEVNRVIEELENIGIKTGTDDLEKIVNQIDNKIKYYESVKGYLEKGKQLLDTLKQKYGELNSMKNKIIRAIEDVRYKADAQQRLILFMNRKAEPGYGVSGGYESDIDELNREAISSWNFDGNVYFVMKSDDSIFPSSILALKVGAGKRYAKTTFTDDPKSKLDKSKLDLSSNKFNIGVEYVQELPGTKDSFLDLLVKYNSENGSGEGAVAGDHVSLPYNASTLEGKVMFEIPLPFGVSGMGLGAKLEEETLGENKESTLYMVVPFKYQPNKRILFFGEASIQHAKLVGNTENTKTGLEGKMIALSDDEKTKVIFYGGWEQRKEFRNKMDYGYGGLSIVFPSGIMIDANGKVDYNGNFAPNFKIGYEGRF